MVSRETSPRPPIRALVVVAIALLLLATGCSGEAATPIDPANPPTTANLTDVSHSLPPTDQMRTAARQQCLDDPNLDAGYVQAVVPETGEVLSEITIECDEVGVSDADGAD